MRVEGLRVLKLSPTSIGAAVVDGRFVEHQEQALLILLDADVSIWVTESKEKEMNVNHPVA